GPAEQVRPHELQHGHPERHQDVPPEPREEPMDEQLALARRERRDQEDPPQREPQPDAPGQVDGIQDLVTGRPAVERPPDPVHERPDPPEPERAGHDDLEDPEPGQRRAASARSATTSSSSTWSKSRNHCPTA